MHARAGGRGTPPQAQGPARGARAQGRGEFVHAGHQLLSGLLSCSSRASKAATFFWTAITRLALSSWTWSLSRSRVSCAISSASSPAGIDLGAALLRRQRRQVSHLALASPGAQGRRIHALTAHQRADLAGLGAAVGGVQNATLVGVGEMPAPGTRHDLRVGVGRHRPAPPIRAHLQSPYGLLAMRPDRANCALRAWRPWVDGSCHTYLVAH